MLSFYRAMHIVAKHLTDGIVIFGERYHFFSASGSQLREHSSIFLKTESVNEVYALRDEIVINGHEFRSVPKYLARLGLFSTADTPKGSVQLSAVGLIDDVKVRNRVLYHQDDGYFQ